MKINLCILLALLILFGTSCIHNRTDPDKNMKPVKHSGTEPVLYEWRGPERSGIYNEVNLLPEWPAGGPAELWTVEQIGNGYGSPVTDGNHIYITGEIDSMAVLHCISMEGKPEWQLTLGKEWNKSHAGSRSAPTLFNGLIYAGTGVGDLYCIDKENVKVIWNRNFMEDFNGIMPLFGHSEAPLVSGNQVFWTPGGNVHNVVALNRFSGDLVWSNKGFGERSGYNQPKLIGLTDKQLFVTFSAYHLLGFDAASGELLWSHEQINIPVSEREPGKGDTHSNTVLYEEGNIYYAAGDGNGGVKLKLSEDGREIKQLWRNNSFDGYMGGIVKIDDYLYGGVTAKPEMLSVHSETGKIKSTLKVGSGAVIAADDRLYYYNHRGEMKLIGYDEGELWEISSFRISKGTGEHFSHPVIYNRVLYLRHGNVLMAFDIGL
ncbi:MAG: PQQ-like beta-propeller repeat protein [Bacteroidales bacterium]|nr:PQQ-like beta-propeller repeat protein [Bacteroidales bacterium]